MSRATCAICGRDGYDREVTAALVRWKDGTYGWGPRCRDTWSCYQICREIGEEWPLQDRPRPPDSAPAPPRGDIAW